MIPLIQELEADAQESRLAALQEIVRANIGSIRDLPAGDEVNNHVHTHYSFSPYSPSSVAYRARVSGLQVVGSVDHDSIGAAREMIDAAEIAGIAATVGCELRAGFENTPFAERRLNNPDTPGNAYIVFHGVPIDGIDKLSDFLSPLREVREVRSEKELSRINDTLKGIGIKPLDYHRDVRPFSWADRGGSLTERHLLYAMADALLRHCRTQERVLTVLEEDLRLSVAGIVRKRLLDEQNPHYLYDLLGVLKSQYLPTVFVQPDPEECLPVEQACAFARSLGAIPAYAYLGDVGISPTGDKAAQHFEDAFLDELFPTLVEVGFQSVTYMPPRNTREQLLRVQKLCQRYELLEISGVDINSSRQTFTCPEILEPEFRHLNDTTWALVAHERLSARDYRYGLFHPDNPLSDLLLPERVRRYRDIGKGADPEL